MSAAARQRGKLARGGRARALPIGEARDDHRDGLRERRPDGAERGDGAVGGRVAEPELDEGRPLERDGQRRPGRGGGLERTVSERDAHRQAGRRGRPDLAHHAGGRRAQRAGGGVLHVDDVGPAGGGVHGLRGVDDADEQAHRPGL